MNENEMQVNSNAHIYLHTKCTVAAIVRYIRVHMYICMYLSPIQVEPSQWNQMGATVCKDISV